MTNGTKIRGYDPATGKLLWTLGPNSEVTVGTPVAGTGVVYVTGGYPPVRPIYAVRPGGTGDISLAKGASEPGDRVEQHREGTYIPTPLAVRRLSLHAQQQRHPHRVQRQHRGARYRARVGDGGAFSASPIAADGRSYFASEDGDVYVVDAGAEYAELAKSDMKEVIMATPRHLGRADRHVARWHVYGIGLGSLRVASKRGLAASGVMLATAYWNAAIVTGDAHPR